MVNTHGNGDHWYGNSLLPEAQIIAARATVTDMRRVPPAQMIELLNAPGPAGEGRPADLRPVRVRGYRAALPDPDVRWRAGAGRGWGVEELARGGPALELAMGTGRVGLWLAARGLRVDGIEASPEMVDKLRAKPGGEDIAVIIGDMADVTVPGTYRLIFLVFNTLFNLQTQDESDRDRDMRRIGTASMWGRSTGRPRIRIDVFAGTPLR